jgi:hypothetical protein
MLAIAAPSFVEQGGAPRRPRSARARRAGSRSVQPAEVAELAWMVMEWRFWRFTFKLMASDVSVSANQELKRRLRPGGVSFRPRNAGALLGARTVNDPATRPL